MRRLVYEAIICCLMVAALACIYYYVFVLSPGAPVQTNFNVYDAGVWTFRWSLLAQITDLLIHQPNSCARPSADN